MAPSLIMEKSQASSQAEKSDVGSVETPDANYLSTLSDVFYETRSVISTLDSDPVKEIIEEKPQSENIREATPDERASQPDPILFAKLTGQQELALKLKHSEEVEGPKVEVSILLGSFLLFITPRQLHTLIEIVDALNQPHLEDTRYLCPSNMLVELLVDFFNTYAVLCSVVLIILIGLVVYLLLLNTTTTALVLIFYPGKIGGSRAMC